MKKVHFTGILLVTASLVLAVTTTKTVAAATPYVDTITASPTSAVADGTSAITLTITSQVYRCSKEYISYWPDPLRYYVYPHTDTSECTSYFGPSGIAPHDLSPAELVPYGNQAYNITASGSGNNLSASSITTDANGHATVTLTSTVVETKTVQLISTSRGTVVATMTVAFTATPSPAKKTAPQVQSPVSMAVPPATPTVNAVTVDGIKVDTSKPLKIAQDKQLVLSGTTVANGVVTLTTHSNPQTITTVADSNGNWSYSVTELAPGDHYIEASVTDPATNQTSASAKLLAFTVKTPAPASTQSTPVHKPARWPYVVGIALLATAIVAGWFIWKKHAHAKES